MEDLNGKLLERAELIAEQEEVDILLEQKKCNDHSGFDFAVELMNKTESIAIQMMKSYVGERVKEVFAEYLLNQQSTLRNLRQRYGDAVYA
jgi:predicted PilT family ATPase